MEWISFKRSGLDIYITNLISIGFNEFHVVASNLYFSIIEGSGTGATKQGSSGD